MKKIITISILAMLVLVGCGEAPYDTYQEAVANTEAIESKGYESKVTTSATINTDGLDMSEKREVNFFKNVSVAIDGQYDYKNKRMKQVFHYNLNGIGFDMTYYQIEDQKLLKLPFIDKYIVISDELSDEDKANESDDYISPSDETLEAIDSLWSDTVEKDKVFKEEKDLVETPEGEIKATRYTIEFTGESIKRFVQGIITLIIEDEVFIEDLESEIYKQVEGEITINIEAFLSTVSKQVEEATLENIKYAAYVSIDNFIIKETFEAKVLLQEEANGRLESIDIGYEGILFDINETQEIELPELTDENTTTMKDFGEGFPITIEGFNK